MQIRIVYFVTLLTTVAGLAGCGSGSGSTPTQPTQGSTVTVSIVAGASTLTTTAYNPNPITISRGSSIVWVNNDTRAHNSTSDSNAFSSGAIAPGASFTQPFQTAGTFTYHCAFHPGMVGTVVVQ
jgi:plastocyanin